MKHSLLIALLGVTISLGTPSLAIADNAYKFKGGTLDQHAHTKHKHKNKHKRHVAKHKKQHRKLKHKNRDRRFVKNHHHNKHKHNKHVKKHYYHDNKPSFSISWNVGDSTISYGNDNYAYHNNHNYKKHRGKRIYKRLNNQKNRIHRGVQNGQLVKREVKKLRREQRYLRDTLSHYKRDGHLNHYERSKMHQLLDVANNNIHRKMNNHRTRYSQQHYNYGYAQH